MKNLKSINFIQCNGLNGAVSDAVLAQAREIGFKDSTYSISLFSDTLSAQGIIDRDYMLGLGVSITFD